MEILEKLFGSRERVKLMRLFLFNPDTIFSFSEVSARSATFLGRARKELAIFLKVGLVKRRHLRGEGNKKGNKSGFILDQNFSYLKPVRNLLIQQILVSDAEIIRRMAKSMNKIKLIIEAGVFIQDLDSRVDFLVVGDGIKHNAVDRAIRNLESEIGKEIVYAVFETADFKYRLGMYDKLIRDILVFPHRKVLDMLETPEKTREPRDATVVHKVI